MLSCNHFGVPSFTLHFKNLFRKFPQQRVGYHLVIYKVKTSWQVVVIESNCTTSFRIVDVSHVCGLHDFPFLHSSSASPSVPLTLSFLICLPGPGVHGEACATVPCDEPPTVRAAEHGDAPSGTRSLNPL
jgi:hypothetical protein